MRQRRGTLNIRIKSPREEKVIRPLRWVSIGVIVLFGLVFGYLLVSQINLFNLRDEKTEQQRIESLGVSTEPISQKDVDSYKVNPEAPKYMSISAAGVSKARAIALGVKSPTEDGSQQLDAPKTTSDVGWYDCRINPIESKRCSTPKSPGDGNTETAALFDAHTCFSRTMTCVFDRISQLKNGNKIIIQLGNDKKLIYSVKKVDILNLADVDMKKAMTPLESGEEGLTLITCAGTYKGAVDASGVPTASKRVLVYAILD